MISKLKSNFYNSLRLIVESWFNRGGNFSRIARSSDNADITDAELISEYLKTQRSEYFDLLYKRYSKKVYTKCVTILKDESLAQDATHDIFIKVLLKLSKFEGQSKFSTWLYSITYNYCIDQVRKHKKNKITEWVDEYEGSDTTEEIEDKKLLEVMVERLEIILDTIPVNDKAVLLMKYQDNLSIRDISKIFDKTESAIKMQLKRAKQKFQRRYYNVFGESI